MNRKCSKCGKLLPLNSFGKNKRSSFGHSYTCKKCAAKSRAFRRKTKFLNGFCRRCSRKRLENSANFCFRHWLQDTARQNLGNTKYWKHLKKLAETQEYICVYTGNILIPGMNMSLDHIKPRSKFPELVSDINNVQWVTIQVNKSKSTLAHEEFVSFCKVVSDRMVLEDTIIPASETMPKRGTTDAGWYPTNPEENKQWVQ